MKNIQKESIKISLEGKSITISISEYSKSKDKEFFWIEIISKAKSLFYSKHKIDISKKDIKLLIPEKFFSYFIEDFKGLNLYKYKCVGVLISADQK